MYNNSFVQVHQSQYCNPHRRPLVLAKAQVSAFKSVWNRTSYMWTYKYVPFIFFKNWRTLSLTFPGTPCLESVLGKKCEVQAVRRRARSPASHMCPRYQRRGFSRKSLSRKRLQKTLYYFFKKWIFSRREIPARGVQTDDNPYRANANARPTSQISFLRVTRSLSFEPFWTKLGPLPCS